MQGKSQVYQPEFNKIEVLYNPDLLSSFIEYSKQDSLALYNALYKAQAEYIEE